jgi:hypothetical protein
MPVTAQTSRVRKTLSEATTVTGALSETEITSKYKEECVVLKCMKWAYTINRGNKKGGEICEETALIACT